MPKYDEMPRDIWAYFDCGNGALWYQPTHPADQDAEQYTNTAALIEELEGMRKTFWFPDDREDTIRSDYWNAAIDAVIKKVRVSDE
jgi:hypothetical protein